MSVSHQNFSNRYSCSFSLILTKLGTHDLCANIQKMWNRYSKFCFEIFWQIIQICT